MLKPLLHFDSFSKINQLQNLGLKIYCQSYLSKEKTKPPPFHKKKVCTLSDYVSHLSYEQVLYDYMTDKKIVSWRLNIISY